MRDDSLHQFVEKDATVAAIHDSAEKFNLMTENVFKYLQVGVVEQWVRWNTGAVELGYM